MNDVPTSMKFCKDCGNQVNALAEICPKCGVRQMTSGGKSKTVAGLLGIFLGGLGIHKFYLGETLWGVIYLLACWTGIPALIGFIEGIIYLTMNDERFMAKYA